MTLSWKTFEPHLGGFCNWSCFLICFFFPVLGVLEIHLESTATAYQRKIWRLNFPNFHSTSAFIEISSWSQYPLGVWAEECNSQVKPKKLNKNTSLEIHPSVAQQLLFLFFCELANSGWKRPKVAASFHQSFQRVYDPQIKSEVVPLRLVQSLGNILFLFESTWPYRAFLFSEWLIRWCLACKKLKITVERKLKEKFL